MRNIARYSLSALVAVTMVIAGCSKAGDSGARVQQPDITDFTIQYADPFIKGSAAKVHIYCSTMGAGTYKVHYDLAGYNVMKAQTSTLVVQNNTGVFTTPKLPNAGLTYITINSVTNSNGAGTAFVENNSNNTYTISDSTGNMMATVGAATQFRATNLSAVVDGKNLTITGNMVEPYKSTITLRVNNFTGVRDDFYFYSKDIPQKGQGQYTSERYPNGGFLSSRGLVKIYTVQPTLSGTFYFVGMDSTMVNAGSFDVYTPDF